MTPVQRWSHRDLPAALQWQAVSFIRTVWPSIDAGHLREAYPSALRPTYYTVTDGDILLSMCATYETSVTAAGSSWVAACLGNVFTFPAARRRGLGTRVVDAATRDVRDSAADVAALLCDADLQPFYESSGWEAVPASATITPDGKVLGSLRMMLILSASATAARHHLTSTPFYVPSPW
ncbi:MAG TPA: GNAT family N-acetyltransferase [Microlunatus sp.]|nr:GNAT family N-acetyltransferase [Microlunatus sp.]